MQGIVRVTATLVAERGVRLQLVATCSLANADRLEVGTLDEDVLRLLGNARIQTSEHAGDTHRFSLVADHQVGRRQLALYAVQRNKRCTFGTVTDNNMITFNLIRIKSMQSLTVLMQHEVCDIHNIVDRPEPDGGQRFLQPIRTLLHLYALDHYSAVSGASIGILNRHAYGRTLLIYTEAALIRTCERNLFLSVRLIIGVQVARYAIMRDSVRTVRSNINLDERVVLQVEIFAGRHTYRRVSRQYHYTCMIGADANLVLGTDHTQRFLAADLTFLDRKRLVTAIQDCTDGSDNHLLSGSYVRCTANDLHRTIRGTEIHCSDMQVIGVGVFHTCQHMPDNETFQSASDRLNLLDCTYLQANGGENGCYGLCVVLERDVAF